MPLKIIRTVVYTGLALSCARPPLEPPSEPVASAAPASTASRQSEPRPAPLAPSVTPTPPAQAEPPQSPEATGGATGSGANSAYYGCGEPIPASHLWDETTESQVLDAIGSAKACAAEHGRHLLLEFVAPWCEDCLEMAKLDQTPLVADTLQRRFERVRVNVGKWDRHEALRNNFEVHALATYIVIDPKTSKQLAKTTLEPITKKGKRLSANDWARWLAAH